MYVCKDSAAPAHARTRAHRRAAPRQSSGVSQTPHITACPQAGIGGVDSQVKYARALPMRLHPMGWPIVTCRVVCARAPSVRAVFICSREVSMSQCMCTSISLSVNTTRRSKYRYVVTRPRPLTKTQDSVRRHRAHTRVPAVSITYLHGANIARLRL